MKRRDFLKSTVFFAAVSTIVGKASGLFNEALAAAGVKAAVGKLGYKEVSPQAPKKLCSNCKQFKANAAAGAGYGECILAAMKNANGAKDKSVYVTEGGYCNMWAAKA